MVVVAAVVALAAWMFVLPAGFESVRGLNLRAADAWRGMPGARWSWAWAHRTPSLSLETARLGFRALTVASWVAYALLAWCVFRGARLGWGWTWPVAVPLVLLLAVVLPPALSTDVFAYVGYGRLSAVHGLNPHLHTQVDLVRLGDPTAPYLHWPIASPYGPLWTLLSVAIVRVAPAGAVLGPVMAFKLLAALAVLGAAAAARALVNRVQPARANATFALVALNPLLLLEGPGNAHNDVVTIALILAALVAYAAARPRATALLVGAACAIKLVPLVFVPWLAIVAARAAGHRWSSRTLAAVLTVVIALAPLALAYAPYWEGPRTLLGLRQRWDAGATESAVALWHLWPAVLVVAWATAAVALGQGEPVFRLGTVWAVSSLAIMMFVAGMWFPWYLAWTWPVAVLRFTRPHLVLTGFLLPFSLMLMLAYALPPG